MKLKKLYGFILLGVLASSSMYVFASKVDVPQKNASEVNVVQSSTEQFDVEQELINIDRPATKITNVVVDEPLSGVRGSATYPFSLPPSQLHYRVHVSNTSNSDINVSVGGNTWTVKANTSPKPKVFNSTSSGSRNVDITSKNGSPLSGKASVMIDSTLAEIQ